MMQFSIWDALVGGGLLWQETQSVQVTGGLFNTMLGQVTPIPPTVFAGSAERYLEVRVSGESLTPRQRIAATPFANVAGTADDAAGMGGLPAASYQQRIASACPAGMAVNAIAADGTVTCVQAGTPGCLAGDCRTSWNNQDSASVIPLPRTCPAGQVAISTGPYQWACTKMCSFGTMDCNNVSNDGCETAIATDVNNCGGCGIACSTNNVANLSCSNYLCNSGCSIGFSDCNGNKQTDGCETNTNIDVNHCGTCATVCSSNHISRTCSGGNCNGTCSTGFADCNLNKRIDGCEVNTATDPNNCGFCTHACAAGALCQNGVCVSEFTGSFTGGLSSPPQCNDWQAFAARINATSTYSLVTVKGTNDPTGITCAGATANSLCQAMRAGTPFGPVLCNGRSWVVGVGCLVPGAVELSATGAACACFDGYAVRPCVPNQNWGGLNGPTCDAPSQTMMVTCQ